MSFSGSILKHTPLCLQTTIKIIVAIQAAANDGNCKGLILPSPFGLCTCYCERGSLLSVSRMLI